MGVSLDVSLGGVDELLKDFDGIALRLDDATPFFEGFVVPLMIRSVHLTFEAEGRPDAWKPLDEKTKEARRNKNKSSIAILRDTGALMQSIGSESSVGINEAGKDYATIGTRLVYARTHNEGDPSRGIPQREFMLLQEQDMESIGEAFGDFIVNGPLELE